MSKNLGGLTPSIDLERSELRYIFYAHDLDDIIADFENMGFKPHTYESTPITRTVYFGSKAGLRPGLSIKARLYTSAKIQNVWRIHEDTKFNLLEIKSTVSPSELMDEDPTTDSKSTLLGSELYDIKTRDLVYRIQQASEDGLLKDSTLKSKSRLSNIDTSDSLNPQLRLEQIMQLLVDKSELDDKLSDDLRNLLDERIRPMYARDVIPIVLTQYERIHLVPTITDWKDAIRITIDPGVDYYSIDYKENDGKREATCEFIDREKFCRLEFKIDPTLLSGQPTLNKAISKLLLKYGSLAFLSKKWTGVTLVSEKHIEKLAMWREPIGKQISGYFPVDRSWYQYGVLTSKIRLLIEKSPSFDLFEKDPKVLVKNENFVTGYLGVPVPSLVLMVEGPSITYRLPSRSYPVKLSHNQPEFYILEEGEFPVRRTTISSKHELDQVIHTSIQIEGDTYFRSFGFLVQSKESNRIYKFTIERKVEIRQGKPKSEVYCKMRYLGSTTWLLRSNEQEIVNELLQFYEEFAIIMNSSVDEYNLRE